VACSTTWEFLTFLPQWAFLCLAPPKRAESSRQLIQRAKSSRQFSENNDGSILPTILTTAINQKPQTRTMDKHKFASPLASDKWQVALSIRRRERSKQCLTPDQPGTTPIKTQATLHQTRFWWGGQLFGNMQHVHDHPLLLTNCLTEPCSSRAQWVVPVAADASSVEGQKKSQFEFNWFVPNRCVCRQDSRCQQWRDHSSVRHLETRQHTVLMRSR
jgi:hypothetical protein